MSGLRPASTMAATASSADAKEACSEILAQAMKVIARTADIASATVEEKRSFKWFFIVILLAVRLLGFAAAASRAGFSTLARLVF